MSSQVEPTGLVIKEEEPLKPYTTFKIGGPARYFTLAVSVEDFRQAVRLAAEKKLPLFILGGGSNILVSDQGFDGVVVHPSRRGIETVREDGESVTLQVHAAEIWTRWSGTVWIAAGGASKTSRTFPGRRVRRWYKNIGAYGQQVSDVVEKTGARNSIRRAARFDRGGVWLRLPAERF